MPTVKDVIVRKPTPEEESECRSWPIWEHGADEFEWSYTEVETCLIIEGEVTVSDAKSSVSFGPGDLVIFPTDLDCVWKIKKPVRKYYNFS